MRLNPYLFFNGQCEAAFNFYKQCLGGSIVAMISNADSPMADQTPPELRDSIIHARLVLDDQVLMGADAPPEYFEQPQGFTVTLNIADPQEAERVFNALAEGATIRMPLGETFWAVRFGMLIDRFGIPWMINCEKIQS